MRAVSSHQYAPFFLGTLFLISVTVPLPSPVSGADNKLDERIEISSSPNPVGSGARATGMGGAFIAVCDDATAASWNPAGLIQLERPEFSVAGEYVGRREETRYEAFPDGASDNGQDTWNLNYMSLVYPFQLLRTVMTRNTW